MPGRETGCSPAAVGWPGPTRLRERLFELAASGRPLVADLDQGPPADRGTALRPRTTRAGSAIRLQAGVRTLSRLFRLMVVFGELVPGVFVGDRPVRAVLGEGQRPGPVENGGYPVAPADQVEDENDAPHRVAGDAGERHPERVGHGGQVADG